MENDILDRIVFLLKEKGLDQQDLISYLSLPRGTFSNWIRGKSHSYYEHLNEIGKYLGVTSQFLATGLADNYIEKTMSCITESEIEIIKLYNKLEPKAKNTVREMLLLLTNT